MVRLNIAMFRYNVPHNFQHIYNNDVICHMIYSQRNVSKNIAQLFEKPFHFLGRNSTQFVQIRQHRLFMGPLDFLTLRNSNGKIPWIHSVMKGSLKNVWSVRRVGQSTTPPLAWATKYRELGGFEEKENVQRPSLCHQSWTNDVTFWEGEADDWWSKERSLAAAASPGDIRDMPASYTRQSGWEII